MREDKRPFTKEQPRNGETILHCGHSQKRPQHFYCFGPGMPYGTWESPSGKVVKSRWMVLCDDCNKTSGLDAVGAIKAFATWRESGPVIRSIGRSGDEK